MSSVGLDAQHEEFSKCGLRRNCLWRCVVHKGARVAWATCLVACLAFGPPPLSVGCAAEQTAQVAMLRTTEGCLIGRPILNVTGWDVVILPIAITWSGPCEDGWVSGSGLAIAKANDQEVWHYDGEMRSGLFNGRGTFHNESGVTAAGVFRDGAVDGPIIITMNDGYRYEGEWKIDHKEGHGVELLSNGARYEGDWHDGQKEGRGVMTWSSGNRYDGTWHNGKKEGTGMEYTPRRRRDMRGRSVKASAMATGLSPIREVFGWKRSGWMVLRTAMEL